VTLSTTSPGAVDDDGFADFVRGSQARLVHLAELLTRDRGRAEDLAQHAYAKAFASWGRVRRGDPEAYVRRCVTNANIDWWRRRTWRERPSEILPEAATGASSGNVPNAANNSGDPAPAIANRDLVLRALARLTDRERTVVALRFYLDMPETQVAAELGLRPGTVKSTTARALAKLRQDADLRADLTSEVL
jgi:RNA polymerase sigma-70 factor (sigma-E family)